MASPAALLGIAYVAAIFTQVCGSPFWSQPDCPDQGQSGYWSGSDYESQGPSYKQTLQAMLTETLRCIQQVIQVTKREMILLLGQLAQDADCNTQTVSYDEDTSGQVQFPPPDSGYNYDRPQEQFQYPAQYQQHDPVIQPQPQLQIQPLIKPQVPIHYQPQVQPQEIPQSQHLPDSQPVLNTDTYVVNSNHDNADHSQVVPSSTVGNKISLSTTPETNSENSENTSTKPQTLAELVERPIVMENIKTPNTSEDIQVQSGNSSVSSNSSISDVTSNITVLTHSDPSTSTALSNISHDSMMEHNVTDSRPAVTLTNLNTEEEITSTELAPNATILTHSDPSTSTASSNISDISTAEYNGTDSRPEVTSSNFTTEQEMISTEKATHNDGVEKEHGEISSNNSSTIVLTNTPILVHGAPISLLNVVSTTARSNNTTDSNYSENTLTIPPTMDNEVDANMEKLPDENEMSDKNILSSNNVTTSSIPVEQTSGNHSEINAVTLKYNNSVESIKTVEGNASGPQQNMTSESTTKMSIEFSAFVNSTHESTTETTSESGSTMTIDEHELQNITTSTTAATILVRKPKL